MMFYNSEKETIEFYNFGDKMFWLDVWRCQQKGFTPKPEASNEDD